MATTLEVICGPMFAGKTGELFRRMRRAEIAGQRTVLIKPARDTRSEDLVSHDGVHRAVTIARTATEILDIIRSHDAHVVGIDEAQFFDPAIVDVMQTLGMAQQTKRRIIIAGLDTDSSWQPIGSMGELLVMADRVTKLSAICVRCGDTATRTKRLVPETDQVLVGAGKEYEARCTTCWLQ